MAKATIAASVILLSLATAVQADCRAFFRKQIVVQQVAVAVPVAVYPPVYYAAGADIQAEALAVKVAALVEQKLALRQQQTAPPATILAQRCAKCHSGPQPKGGYLFDGSPIPCHQITAAIRAVSSDKMPKGGPPLSPEHKGQLLEELLALEIKAQPIPPPPVPDGELQ